LQQLEAVATFNKETYKMKKILFSAIASVAFAFSAQAVMINWGCSYLDAPDLSELGVTYTKVLQGQTATHYEYLWTANSSSDLLTEAMGKGTTATITITEGTSGQPAFSVSSSFAFWDVEGVLAGTFNPSQVPGSTQGFLATVTVFFTDEDGDVWTATASNSFNTTGAGFPNVSFSGATWTKTTFEPIPEPATMALLGIGIVAVGLRRRRK